MSNEVYIAGVGMTPFGKFRDVSVEDLARTAVLRALADSACPRDRVEEAFVGSSYGGPLVGQRILRGLGMTGMSITNVENACSSGSTALRNAVAAIRSGSAQTVLVVGVDKLTQFGGGTLPLQKTDPDVVNGVMMPAVYAMRACRYLNDTDATADDLAAVSVKARHNGSRNVYAQFQKPVDKAEVLGSRMIADPLTLLMSCPTGDGAAALLVTSDRDLVPSEYPVKITASVLQSGKYEAGPKDIARSELTARTVALAYEQSGLGPTDIDIFEVHDAFAIAELMYYEALGLCEYGGGPELLRRDWTQIEGQQPVNPSGGLLARGHPIGATGVAQIVESVWQMRGQAGQHQVPRQPRTALTHCTGGGISGLDHGACTIHVLAV